jgi:HAD superfamily hydrolase (TIGR01509 family)
MPIPVLDLMGTLITDPYREALRAGSGLGLTELRPLIRPSAWPAFERGELDETAWAEAFWADPEGGRMLNLEAFHAARRAGYAWLPGMEELFDELCTAGPCWVASNYPATWIAEVAARFRLHERCTGVVASSHLGARKPAAAFYERFLDGAGLAAADCVLIDDREENCAGARAVGMRAIRFTVAAELRATLRTASSSPER